VLSPEQSRQRLLTSFHHHAFPHPLPKLGLRRPKLFPVATDHERRFLFTFLLLVHADTPVPLRSACGHTQYPVGKPLLRGSI